MMLAVLTSNSTEKAHLRATSKVAFLPSVLDGLRLLTRHEKKRAGWLAGVMLVGSFLEIVALAAILPFVNIVIQPQTIQTNEYLQWAYQWIGVSDLSQFISLVGLGVIVLTALSVLANWEILYAQNRYAASCQTRLAQDLLDRCMHAPYSWFLTRNSTLLSRLVYDDVVIWSRGLVQRLMMMISNISVVAMALGVVLKFSIGTGFFVIAAVGAFGYATMYRIRPLLIDLAATKRAALDAMSLTANQALVGIKDIKLSSRETYFRDIFNFAYSTATASHARLNVWQETPSLIMQGLAQVTLVILAVTFWNMEIDRNLIATQLALLVIVTAKVVPTVSRLSTAVSGLFNAFPHIYAIRETLDSIEVEKQRVFRDEGSKKALHVWHELTFEGVGYQYSGSSDWALQGLTMSLLRRGSYGIVGPSAAGKSTFVDLFVGLLEPTAGRICIDGSPLHSFEIKAWQKRIAYVPQMPFIADDTLRANVAFGMPQAAVDDKWVIECLRLANLATLPDELENGLDAKLGERGLRLSGGQRQRIAVARALFNKPEILVLDEATSALDSIAEEEILATLKNLHGQITTITIAHRLSTVMPCDQIFLLERGRLVGQGAYAHLRANHELFRRMAAAGQETC